LHYLQLGAHGDGLEGDGGTHLAGQVGVVKPVGVDDALMGHQFQVLPPKRVHLSGGKVAKLHAVAPAYARIQLEHAAGETVRR
jgi:hypothetical protein